MSCACGHHHPKPIRNAEGVAVSLTQPMIALNGRLICEDTAQMMAALSLLPEHVRLSREEPGCLRFDIWQDDDPMIWHLAELFTDADAFTAHQQRNAASEWGRQSSGIGRDFSKNEVAPIIRQELSSDIEAIDLLLREAFGGSDEANLVAELRRDGDLSLSLIAEAEGIVIGHLGLSPLAGDRVGLALAPVAVSPKVQRRGIGGAMINHALGYSGDTPMVVLGDPEYYGAFGFVPADLSSPYAGPYLQLHGDMAPGSKVVHAPAFGKL